jgi:hypothetical protein
MIEIIPFAFLEGFGIEYEVISCLNKIILKNNVYRFSMFINASI